MTKEQILQQFGGDEKAFYAQFPTQAHYDEYRKGGMVKKKIPIYGNGGKIPSYNFGGTTNILQQRVGDIDSTKQGINRAASIYGTVAGEVANVAAMIATAGASGAAGAGASGGAGVAGTEGAGGGSALGGQASQALTTAKTVNNAQTGGNLNTGGGIGDAIGGKDVSGIGGMVKKQYELYGKVGAELFGKGISDTKNRSIYAGLGQTNQAKEKYLGIENTADVYGQRPGMAPAVAKHGMTIPNGGYLNGPNHEQGGIPILAEGGEAVMTQEAVHKFAPILSAMNQSVGGNPITPGQSTSYAEDGTLVGDYGAFYGGNPNSYPNSLRSLRIKIPGSNSDTMYRDESTAILNEIATNNQQRNNPDTPQNFAPDGTPISQIEADILAKNQAYKINNPLASSTWQPSTVPTPTLKPGVHQGNPLVIPGVTDVDENGYPISQGGAVNSNGTPSAPPGFVVPNTNGSTYNPNAITSPNRGGIPLQSAQNPSIPNYSMFLGSPNYSPTYPVQPVQPVQKWEAKPGYGMEAVEIGSNIASLVNNALQRYDAGPKPIPMTAEEERTNRFVERNNDLNNIGISAATQIASNKTSSASGKLAASLGVYSNIIDKKMNSEAKWYGEEEAAKNRNIALRNTVSNSNRMELNAYNANEANNRNQFKQTKAQMISNDVNNAIETASNWDESRKADATSMIQMDAYSKMIQIPQLTAQWNASQELRTKYNSPSDYINAVMDPNQFNNEMSKYPRYFRPVKNKKK